jgi:hypothetical protein
MSSSKRPPPGARPRVAAIEVRETKEIVLLRGATLLHADTLIEIATLDKDGQWRTPDGAITDAIGVPQQAAHAIVKPAERRAADRARDEAWKQHALDVLRDLAERRPDLTVDDLWETLDTEPREPRQITSLILTARTEGWIERTNRHRQSARAVRHGREVRVWRSLIYTPAEPGA